MNTTEIFPAAAQDSFEHITLEAAAELFSSVRYEDASLERIAQIAGVEPAELITVFPTLHAAGAAVLTAEGNSMREAMATARDMSSNPLEILARTFQLIGTNMAELKVVRAGMRLADEARQHFPERRIDPYRTWHAFVSGELEAARNQGLLRNDIDIDSVTWLIVSAGMGTKDLVAFRDAWAEIAVRLSATLSTVLQLVQTTDKR